MSQCDACGLKFASEMELIDHKFTWEHLAKETAKSKGTTSTSGTPSNTSATSSTHSDYNYSKYHWKHPGTETATTLLKKSANGNSVKRSPMLSASQEHLNTVTSTPQVLLPEPLMRPVFSSSSVQDDYMKHRSHKQSSCERKIVSKMTSIPPQLPNPPRDQHPFSHPLYNDRPPPPPHQPPPPPQPHQPPYPSYHHYPSRPPYHHYHQHPPYNHRPPQHQHPPFPWPPQPPPQHQHPLSPWPPQRHHPPPPPLFPPRHHRKQHQTFDHAKSPSKSPSRRKSSSPRRHNPTPVLDKTNSPTPITNVANGIHSFSAPTSLTSISRPTPVLPITPDRVQSPLVASVKSTDSVSSSKDIASPILPSVAHKVPASTSGSAEFANSTNGRSTASYKPIVLNVSDRAKRDSSRTSSSVPENAEQSNSYLQATAAVSTSQGKNRSRKGKIIVDEIPKLVPPLTQKPHRRNYPPGEELVTEVMQLSADCDFLPLEIQMEEEGQDSSAPSQVKESSSNQGEQTSTILPNRSNSLLSENSVAVSGLTNRTNVDIDKDEPTVPTSEALETSPSANKGSSASLITVGEVFVNSSKSSSELTSQESTESFYTAPAYSPTKTADHTVIKTEACGPAAKHIGIKLELTTKEPQTTNSFLDTTEKVSCSPVEPPALVSTPPSDEPMEWTSDLEPNAMEVGLDNEDSSCCISPLLTAPVLQTEPVASTVAPCVVSRGLPTTNSTVAVVSTLGSLMPASRISTSVAQQMAQVELSLAVVRPPVVTTWASASTGTVLTSTCTVPTMSTSVVASTEDSSHVVAESEQQEAGKQESGKQEADRPEVKAIATGFGRVDSILSSFLESDIAEQIAIKTQKSGSESVTDRPPSTISSYNGSKTLLKRKLFTEIQNVPKSDVTENTIETLQQKVFEEAEKFFNIPLTVAFNGDKMATSPVQKHPPDNDVFGAPPESTSFVGKLGIYSPTHPDWPESSPFANSEYRVPQEKDELSSSPASETQVTWNMGDFLCNPQTDQQSIGETSIADSPNTPLLCTYKTCKQPVYHESSRLCKEHFEAAKAITAKLGIPEPPSSGTASVPTCSCSGCDEPQYDRSSRLCQQHFEMGCRIKSKLAISSESSSLPCSVVQPQSHAKPAHSVNQRIPRKRTSSGVGDSGLNNQTSTDFTIGTEMQKGVSAGVVGEAPPFILSIPPSLAKERADPSVLGTPSPSLTPSSTVTVSQTQVMWDMDDFLYSPQSDQQDIGEATGGMKAPALCTSKSCKEPVYHENSRLCREHFEAAKAITAKLGIPEPPSSEAPVCSCTGCNKPQHDRSSKLCQQHFELGCRIKSKLAIPVDNRSLPCSVAQTQSNATSTQTESQVHNKRASSGFGDNGETNCATLQIGREEEISGTQMQDTAFIVQMSSVSGSRRSAAASGKSAVSIATTRTEGISSESRRQMVQAGAVNIEPLDFQYGLDDVEPGIDPPLPKRRKLNTKGKKRSVGDGVVQPRAKSKKVMSAGVVNETSPSVPPSLPRDPQSTGPGALQVSSPSLRPDFKVEISSLNTKEQLLQQNLLDLQSRISDMSERVKETEEELAELKRDKAPLQERHQKLITECQVVLGRKQDLLLQLQGGRTPGAGDDTQGAEPNSEFVCLNEKEQELQKHLLMVQGELLEMNRRIEGKEGALDEMRKEEEQLLNFLPELQAQYQEVLLQKQTLFCSPSPVGNWPVLQGVSCKSEPVSPEVIVMAVKSSEHQGEETPEVVHGLQRDALGSRAVLAVETSGTTEDDHRPSPDSSVALIRRDLKTSDLADGSRGVWQERHHAGPGLSVDAVQFEPHSASVLSMKVLGNRLYTCSADKTIRAYDTLTGAIIQRYQKHQKTVICLELYTQSPGTTYLLSGSSDKILHIYNAESGKLVTRFKCGVRIMYLCLHNHIVFAGLSTGSVLCIDLKKKQLLGKQTCHPDDHGSSISCLSVTDTFLFTAAFDKKVFCWDVQEFLVQGVFNAPFRLVHQLEFSNTVLCMKVCDRLLYCGCSDATLLVYNTQTWESVKEIRCHKGAVSGLHIMGKVLITASFDKLIRCFDLERLELLQVYAGNSTMVFTLCAANGVIYTGLKDGTVQATALDLTIFYPCKWENCGLRFGNFNHLREHLKEHISSSSADGLASCKWGECSNTMLPGCLLEHLDAHTSELLVESSE